MKHLVDFLFPKVCAACDRKLLQHEKVICIFCSIEISYTNDHLDFTNDTYKMFKGRLNIHLASSLMYYEKFTTAQKMIQDLKYHHNEQVSSYIGQMHARLLSSVDKWYDIDVVIPVPINKKKLKKRGYNQVLGYAKALAEQFKAELNTKAIRRKNETTSQVLKGKYARTQILKSHYFKGDVKELEGKHLLLVDDIITTGSTIEACGKILEQIPDTKLSLASMALAVS
jgi:ComF family protein